MTIKKISDHLYNHTLKDFTNNMSTQGTCFYSGLPLFHNNTSNCINTILLNSIIIVIIIILIINNQHR